MLLASKLGLKVVVTDELSDFKHVKRTKDCG